MHTWMTVDEAKLWCDGNCTCSGFTWDINSGSGGKHELWFKGHDGGPPEWKRHWHAYTECDPSACPTLAKSVEQASPSAPKSSTSPLLPPPDCGHFGSAPEFTQRVNFLLAELVLAAGDDPSSRAARHDVCAKADDLVHAHVISCIGAEALQAKHGVCGRDAACWHAAHVIAEHELDICERLSAADCEPESCNAFSRKAAHRIDASVPLQPDQSEDGKHKRKHKDAAEGSGRGHAASHGPPAQYITCLELAKNERGEAALHDIFQWEQPGVDVGACVAACGDARSFMLDGESCWCSVPGRPTVPLTVLRKMQVKETKCGCATPSKGDESRVANKLCSGEEGFVSLYKHVRASGLAADEHPIALLARREPPLGLVAAALLALLVAAALLALATRAAARHRARRQSGHAAAVLSG